MNRVAILGNAGSGKTYLAAQLGSRRSLPVVDLDDLFWKPPDQYTIKRPADELIALVEAKKLEPNWIVEGVYGELIQLLLEHTDLLIWVDTPWEVSRCRLEQRHSRGGGASDDPAFVKLMAYAAAYWNRDDGRSHAGHLRIFEAFAREKRHFTSERAVNAFLGTVTTRGA